MERINQLNEAFATFIEEMEAEQLTATTAWEEAVATVKAKNRPSAKAKKAVTIAKARMEEVATEIDTKRQGHPALIGAALQEWTQATAKATEAARAKAMVDIANLRGKAKAEAVMITETALDAAEEMRLETNAEQTDALAAHAQAKAARAEAERIMEAANERATEANNALEQAKAAMLNADEITAKAESAREQALATERDITKTWNDIIAKAAARAVENDRLLTEAQTAATVWITKGDAAKATYEKWAEPARGSGESWVPPRAPPAKGKEVPAKGKEGKGKAEAKESAKKKGKRTEREPDTQGETAEEEEELPEVDEEPKRQRVATDFSIHSLAKRQNRQGGRTRITATEIEDALENEVNSEDEMYGVGPWMRALQEKQQESKGTPSQMKDFENKQRMIPPSARITWGGFHKVRKDLYKLSTVKLVTLIEGDAGVAKALTALMIMGIITEGTASNLREWAATIPDKEGKDGIGYRQVREIVALAWVQLLKDLEEDQSSSEERDDEEVTRHFTRKLGRMVKKEWRIEFLHMVRKARELSKLRNTAKNWATEAKQTTTTVVGKGNGNVDRQNAQVRKAPPPPATEGENYIYRPPVCWPWLSTGNCTLQGCKFLHATNRATVTFLAKARGAEVTPDMVKRASETRHVYNAKVQALNPGKTIPTEEPKEGKAAAKKAPPPLE